MYRVTILLAVLLTALAAAPAAMAASPSELLEKGIYTEETVGNLDEAIAIYEKVVAEAKASHALAAQAQYRLGQCLLKKGKKAEATAAFQKVISDFADQKELVAKAQKFVPEGIQLEPVPWVDGEVLQFRMRMAGGLDIGTVIYVAQSAELHGQKIWRVGSRMIVILNSAYGESHVDADWSTFRPISSVFRMSTMGTFIAEYTPTQIVVTIESLDGSKSTKKHDTTQVAYDNEQAMDVIRRLPLTSDYKTTLPVFATMGAGNIDIPLEVRGKEKVNVPAGEFECFKVHLGLVNQDFWVSADSHRYLVKFEANAVAAELTSIDRIESDKPRQYMHIIGNQGVSLAVPSDWFFYSPSNDEKGVMKTYLIDPQAVALSVLSVSTITDAKSEERKSIKVWAEGKVAEGGKVKKDFKVRPDSWSEMKVAGLPAISVVADFIEGKRKMAGYWTYVRGDSITLTFAVLVPEAQFEDFRKQFDPIIQSLMVKQP